MLELLPWSCGICRGVRGGPWGFLSSRGPAAASVLPAASQPGWVTTFIALCSNLKTGSLWISWTFFPCFFHKSWCLPFLKELPLLVYLQGLKVDFSLCQLTLVRLKLPLPAQEPSLAGCAHACLPVAPQRGPWEAVSPKQKAAMWGSKRLSMAMSEERVCFLRVGVCFHSCEGE